MEEFVTRRNERSRLGDAFPHEAEDDDPDLTSSRHRVPIDLAAGWSWHALVEVGARVAPVTLFEARRIGGATHLMVDLNDDGMLEARLRGESGGRLDCVGGPLSAVSECFVTVWAHALAEAPSALELRVQLDDGAVTTERSPGLSVPPRFDATIEVGTEPERGEPRVQTFLTATGPWNSDARTRIRDVLVAARTGAMNGARRISFPRSSGVGEYAAAVAFVGIAAVLMAFVLSLSGLSVFTLFGAAVMAAHLRGGIGPALLALALATLGSVYAFVPPHMTWETESSPWRLPLFYTAAILFAELLRRHGWSGEARRHR
ncbi:MAG: DUF4118 domain-containing protein [Sandaracinaceae bacterium]|nr:DUF4118 domain-containing protein [Sandaracinaceae bacterium]